MENFKLENIIPPAFSEREKQVVQFVHLKHFPQKRKYSEAPYVAHLINVAKLVQQHTGDSVATAGALCHDLFEDTDCSETELKKALMDAGYPEEEGDRIVQMTWDLTDRFTKTEYPRLNRRERKRREAERMKDISPAAASVKLADLNDNLTDLLKTDTEFAAIYLREARTMLPHLEKGNKTLYEKMIAVTEEADRHLTELAQEE